MQFFCLGLILLSKIVVVVCWCDCVHTRRVRGGMPLQDPYALKWHILHIQINPFFFEYGLFVNTGQFLYLFPFKRFIPARAVTLNMPLHVPALYGPFFTIQWTNHVVSVDHLKSSSRFRWFSMTKTSPATCKPSPLPLTVTPVWLTGHGLPGWECSESLWRWRPPAGCCGSCGWDPSSPTVSYVWTKPAGVRQSQPHTQPQSKHQLSPLNAPLTPSLFSDSLTPASRGGNCKSLWSVAAAFLIDLHINAALLLIHLFS